MSIVAESIEKMEKVTRQAEPSKQKELAATMRLVCEK
jgi:hypothetical protein